MAAESPNEADGRRGDLRRDCHTVAHCLSRFQMLMDCNKMESSVAPRLLFLCYLVYKFLLFLYMRVGVGN